MKRRQLLNWAGIGLLASYFPVALAACADADSNTAATTSESETVGEFENLGTTEELQQAGYLLNKESKVIVVRDINNELSALNPVCTHQGCIVEWSQDANTLVCPCHNAKYAPNGEVLAAPAPAPLASYQVKEENGEIMVRLS
jgi:cytochrome b6-f complex iron-sulfur subunit